MLKNSPDDPGSTDPRAGQLDAPLESLVEMWRTHLRRGRAVTGRDVEELEDHLREQIEGLRETGLTGDEAFLVAVKRMGALDELTREFAREHSERLWKQLVLSGGEDDLAGFGGPGSGPRSLGVAIALAIGAGAAIKVPALFGASFDGVSAFYPLNVSLLVLPFVVGYFAWARRIRVSTGVLLAMGFAFAAGVVNAYPFVGEAEGVTGHTQVLTSLHLPMVLWLGVGIAYVGGRWRGSDRRMDFIRFTGEFFVYFVLIALGGAVLIALTFALFEAIGVDVEPVVEGWILPCGAAGATVVASWLVEVKQSVVENMAPVLARIFVPLFTLLLLAFVFTMGVTGRGLDVDREILIAVDLLLVVVFGLLLYSISARDPVDPPGLMDGLQLALVAVALLVDGLALWAIGVRISDLGFTPNRTAALGMNVVLLGNLVGSAYLYLRFIRGGGSIARLWEWQTTYLYLLVGWAAVVAFLFPPLFGFR